MPLDLVELMKLYARRGIADWNAAPALAKQKASFVLANKIADNEWEAIRTIEANVTEGGDERCMFIPMPNINHSGVQHCFFLPIRMPEQGKAAFDLFLFVDGKNCLGFRFEPADPPDSTHDYGHVQMNRSMFRKTIAVKGIPQWLPDSYPAFPIRSSEPLQMFLSMATSVHGYGKGMMQVVQEIFQNRPNDQAKYLEALKGALI